MVDPPGVSTVSATTSTGTRRIRISVSAFGRLSGNKSAGLSYPAPPSGPQRTVLELVQEPLVLGTVAREGLRVRLEVGTEFVEKLGTSHTSECVDTSLSEVKALLLRA